jgi:hypothetical protein
MLWKKMVVQTDHEIVCVAKKPQPPAKCGGFTALSLSARIFALRVAHAFA